MSYPTSTADILSTTNIEVTTDPCGFKRGIANAVAQKYGCFYGWHHGEKVATFDYQDFNGRDCGTKIRTADKRFLWEDRLNPGFFGEHLAGSYRTLIITEGEFDAMAIATATGMKYELAVSVPDGAATAAQTIKSRIDWLKKFNTIVLAFDMDDPGQKAVQEVARLLPGKVKVVQWERKDANEVLLKDGAEKVKWSVVNARVYTPGGLMSDEDIQESITEVREPGIPYPWRFLNERLGGQRAGEITLWLAGSGVGKTTFLGQTGAHYIQEADAGKLGMIFLEDSPQEIVLRLLSSIKGENLYSSLDIDTEAVLEDYKEHLSGRVSLYDPRTGWDIPRIVEAIRWMGVGEECKVVILDHLSAVVGADSQDNEIKEAEQLMYRLRQTAIQTGAHIHVVSHLRKKGGNSLIHEEGGHVTLQDAKGSGAVYQVANTIVALERNTQADTKEERDVTSVRILKGRLTGETGEAGRLFFDRDNYRLTEIEDGKRSEAFGRASEQEVDRSTDRQVGGGDPAPFDPGS